MVRVDFFEHARRLAERKRELGGIDPTRIERARNKGTCRTESKRALLAALAEEAAARGREPTFKSYY